jgi:hypothetical protein
VEKAMKEGLLFRIGDLLGLREPCNHLSREELEDLVEGRLAPDRMETLEAHASACSGCAELLDDLARYRHLVLSGLTIPSERKAFDRVDGAVRERLGLRRTRRGLFHDLASWMSPLWVPAALASVILLLIWLWPSRPQLIASVEHVPLQPPPMVRGLSLSQIWERLEEPWSADDMTAVTRILEPAVREHPERTDLLFYLGVARLRSGDAEGAVEVLLRADRLEAPVPSESTRWMLAAALERVGRTEEACAALDSVVEIGGSRAAAAREIVDRACR